MAIVSVATSNTSLLAAGTRSKIMLDNRGANTIWCIFDATATVNAGFPLDSGDKLTLEVHESDINGALNAIAETGATNLSVYEIN